MDLCTNILRKICRIKGFENLCINTFSFFEIHCVNYYLEKSIAYDPFKKKCWFLLKSFFCLLFISDFCIWRWIPTTIFSNLLFEKFIPTEDDFKYFSSFCKQIVNTQRERGLFYWNFFPKLLFYILKCMLPRSQTHAITCAIFCIYIIMLIHKKYIFIVQNDRFPNYSWKLFDSFL